MQQGGMPGGAAAAPKKKGSGAIIGVVAALAVIGALIGVYFVFFSGPSSQLSKKVPKDTEIFFEIPNVKGALGSVAGMDIIDASKLDSKKWENEIRKGLEDAFEIKKDTAEALMGSIESVAVAQRNVTKSQESVTLVSFSSTDGMEKLLKSERFSKEDDVGKGALYAVEPMKIDDPEEMKDWSGPKKSFARMSYDKKSKYRAFVWFQDAKLLAMGHPDYIEDISSVLDGSDSLANHENWGKAKFEGGSALVYVSPELTTKVDDDSLKSVMKGYFSEVRPFAGSMKFTDAGILTTFTGEMRGNKIGDEDELASAASLDLHERLPEETIGYITLSTKKKEDGKAAKKWLIKKLKSIEEGLGDQADKTFDAMDDEVGFKIEDLFDAVGDQMAIAVAVDRKVEYDEDKKPEEYMESAAVAYLIEIGDADKAKKIVKKVKEKFFEDEGPMASAYDVEDKGAGFIAEPKEEGPTPEIQVIVEKEYILITAGGLAKRFVEAADKKKKTLADDGAHKAAVGSFSGSPRMIMWVDTGWIGGKALEIAKDNEKLSEQLDEFEDETGFNPAAIVTKGDKRLTSAVAFSIDTSSDHWDLKVQSINGELLLAAGSLAIFIPRMMSGGFAVPTEEKFAVPDGPSPLPSPSSGDSAASTGIAECDTYFDKVEKCTALPATSRLQILESKKTMRDAAATSPMAKSSLADSCKKMSEALSMCN